ncbi:MAG: hypothetical protein J6W04_00110 [Bacteroidales bacterium]|nr:hypothetical protein [Bacteroidales bacterium]
MAITCDKFGFFNGIYGLEQANWANYWKGIIPDGIIVKQGSEFEVTTASTGAGMQVTVKQGQAMVDNHRIWNTSNKVIALPAANSSNPRIDTVVLRVIYGNTGESTAQIDILTGTANASPTAPTLTQVTGGTYEIPLADVAVAKKTQNILPEHITDRRHLFRVVQDSVEAFTSTSLTPLHGREYRGSNKLASLTINLPNNPQPTFITSVCFSSGTSSFSGVTFKKGTAAAPIKRVGDSLTMLNKRYNMVIWWDSGCSSYWVAAKGV